jgi:membrane protease YdiL (CAAX protease family)
MENGAVRPPVWKTVLAFAGDVLVVLLLTGAAMVVWLLLGEAMPAEISQHPAMLFFFLASLSAAPLLWVWGCWSKLSIPIKEPLTISFAWGIGAGVLAFLINYPMDWIVRLAGGEMPAASNTQGIEQLFAASTLLGLILVTVLAPVTEELLFRKLFLGRFIRAGAPSWGIVLTSLVFAFMHEPFLTDEQALGGWLLLIVYYFLMGVVLAGVYVRTGRLSAAFAAHATNNLIFSLFYLAM